ncbi:MAG: InlB B-repeat-containing protein [bacterium]|nr:InlB B-repeat-containing protein [bacterium]
MKKTKGLIVLIIFLILFMTSSFAWLNITKKSEKISTLRAGSLSLILDESTTEGISLENIVPVSDKKGFSEKGYTFKLINKGTIKANYIITLDDLEIDASEERMSDSVLKYNLEKNGVIGQTVFLPSIKENGKRVVDKGVIDAKTTNTYTLKLWMDYDATNEAMNKVFFARLNVEAEQENIKEDESKIVIDINDNTKNLGLEEDIENYIIENSDADIATINSLGNIEGKHYGKTIFKTQNKNTGAKKNITVVVTKTLKATFVKQQGVDEITKDEETCILKEKKEGSCSIALPEATPTEGYTFVGFNKDRTSHIGEKSTINISEDTNIYTISKKKEKIYTATFNKQSAGITNIGKESLSCTIKEVYNEEIQEESCKITLPEIEVKEGYTSLGWNTDKNSKIGTLPNTEIEIDSNKNFYTIVMKDAITLSATFNKNGATSLDGNTDEEITKTCVIEESYNNEEQKTSCDITTPTIEASTATPTVCGYTTTSNGTNTCSIKAQEKMTLKENGLKYYAQTYKAGVVHTITWSANGAMIGSTASSCSIDATYNGVAQRTGCDITSPSIARTGYTIYGWNTTASATTSSWNVGVTKQVSSSATYYAITKDTTAPTCGSWSGESTTWTGGNRTISVGCNDSGSGCKQTTYSQTFNSSTTTAVVSFTISDNAGNTRTCSKTANIYLDTVAPSVPTLYRGYQLFGNEKNTSISYNNITATANNNLISIYPTSGDPQIVMTPRFTIRNAFGYIQHINTFSNNQFYQIFYNPSGTGASEANSAARWIRATSSVKSEYLAFGKTMTFNANNSLVRVDIGTAAGVSYNLGGGFIVAEKNQSEPGGANYLVLSTVPTDTGGSGFSHVECNYNSTGYSKLTYRDSQNKFYIYELPSTNANGKVTYCRAVDNAGNKSSTTSATIYTTG